MFECGDQADEAPEKSRPGMPQKDANGNDCFGEHWGMSRLQLGELLCKVRDDPHWNPRTSMRTFVRDYITPWTRGTGHGLALKTNSSKPLLVNRMVSHTWDENVEEFLEQVIKSTKPGDNMFICSFAIYQCEDGKGPSVTQQIGEINEQTPFSRVLRSIGVQSSHVPLVLRCRKRSSMIIVPSRQVDMYSRLWCVFEVYCAQKQGVDVELARTLISCGSCPSSKATCGVLDDEARLRGEIASNGGFECVDAVVRRVIAREERKPIWQSLASLAIFVALAFLGNEGVENAIYSGLIWGPWMVVIRAMHYSQGIATRCHATFLFLYASVFLGAAAVLSFVDVDSIGISVSLRDDVWECCMYIWAYITLPCLVYYRALRQQRWARRRILFMSSMSWLGCMLFPFDLVMALKYLIFRQWPFKEDAWSFSVIMDDFVDGACSVLLLPSYLFTFNVHMRNPRDLKEERTELEERERFAHCAGRAIRPAQGRRLVLLWQRRLFRAVPLRPLPAGLSPDFPPIELADRIGAEPWQHWMTRLQDVHACARRDPRFWLWTFWGYTAVAVDALIPPLLTTPVVLLCYAVLPLLTYCFDAHQRLLLRWMSDFNAFLCPMGLRVKTQIVRKGMSEVVYISFALTGVESEALGVEPAVAYGDSISDQYDSWFDCRWQDYGRVV